jgi:hypothetical protein
MDQDQLANEIRDYLVNEIRVIRDPQNRKQILRDFDGRKFRHINEVAEVFVRLLLHGCDHPLLASLTADILSAFDDFQTATEERNKHLLRQCADRLSIRLEPFWKLVLYLTKGNEPREDGPGVKALLRDVLPRSWQEENPVDQFIAFAREWRHLTAHSAPDVSETDLRLYQEAAFGVYLLVVEENYDALANVVLSEAQRALRDRAGLERYLNKVANPPRLTEYYVPCAGQLDSVDGDSASLTDLFDRFLLDELSQVLVLVGEAGSGKSTFLRWKLADIAQEQLAQLATEGHLYQIPVYYSLRNLQCTEAGRVDQTLLRHVNGLGGWRLSHAAPEEMFGTRGISWVICLDGLDELRDWDVGIQMLERFLETYAAGTGSLIKIVLASRPGVLDNSWREQFAVLKIADWSEAEVQAYANQRLPDLADYFLGWLYINQLADLVRVPILLEMMADFWLQFRVEIEVEIESRDRLGSSEAVMVEEQGGADESASQLELTDQRIEPRSEQEEVDLLKLVSPVQATDYAIKGFLEHQLAKLSGHDRFQKVDRLVEALRQLAFALDGEVLIEADRARMLVGDDLDELVRMSLVTRHHQEVGFGHNMVKLCFAAKELGYRLPEEVTTQQQLRDFLSNLHGRPEFWQQCFAVAPQVLSPDVPYPVWLLPQFHQ